MSRSSRGFEIIGDMHRSSREGVARGFGLVHVDGKNQNDFCRRASVLALRIAASSPAASSMASSSDATAPTQAESGAQFRRRRLYFCSDACDRSSLRSTSSHELLRGSTGAAGQLVTSPSPD